MSPVAIGIIGVVLLVILIFARMPPAFATAFIGFAGYALITGFDSGMYSLGLIPFRSVANFNWAVLPLFLLMSMVVGQAGISRDIYNTAYTWLGGVRGGLAMATCVGCGAFAAISGDSTATALAMGTVAYPEMKKYKYHPSLALGSICAGGTIGILIPPSMGFIIYAILTGASVGRLFMAGLIPGILEVVFYMVTIWIVCLRNPQMGPAGPRATLKHKLGTLKQTWSVAVLFVLVMGGIYLGVFTPTEAGAIGALGAIVIGFSMRRLNRQNTTAAFLDTGRMTAMVLFLLVGAMFFAKFMAVTQIPFMLADYVAALEVNRYIIVIGILVFYILCGCLLPLGATMVLTLPIIFPIIVALGFNPIWYGVLMVRMLEIGLITPPIGIICFILSGVTKVPVGTIYRGIIPFLIADLIEVALLVAFPVLSLWLPTMMKG